MKSVPSSPFATTLGLIYFSRMLDKIRKNAAGELREDFVENLGKGFDFRCCDFLRVSHEALTERTLEGGTDEEILRWCFANGRELNENDIFLFNAALRNRGFRDEASELLARRKQESGLADRADIQTMLDYMEVDEGRRP